MKLSSYTIPELNKFRELCNFTKQELEYFNLKAKDYSNVQIAFEMNISEPLVSKISRKVRDKINKISML